MEPGKGLSVQDFVGSSEIPHEPIMALRVSERHLDLVTTFSQGVLSSHFF